MIRKAGPYALVSLFLLVSFGTASAQLEDNLSSYAPETAEGYLKPLQEAFGQALNSNFFTSAAIPDVGFHASLDIRAMSVFFGSDDETFQAKVGEGFTPSDPSQETVEAPTVVGPEESVYASGTGGTQYVFPGGFNLGSLTIGVPQLTLGGVMGSEVMVRWFAVDTGDAEIGDIKLFGVGGRHSISQYFMNLPVDLAGAIYYQSFKLGDDLIDAKAFSIGVQGSKGFGILTPYGGLSYDSFAMDATYTDKSGAQDEEVKLEMESEKSIHLTAGVGAALGAFRLNAALDVAQRAGFSFGFGFGF